MAQPNCEAVGTKECKNFPTPCDVPSGWTKESEPTGNIRGVGEGGGCGKNTDCQKGLICGAPACARNGGTCTQGTVCQKPGSSGTDNPGSGGTSNPQRCTSDKECKEGTSCQPVNCTDIHSQEACKYIDWMGNYSICKKSGNKVCAQVITRACRTWVTARTKDCPKDSPNCGVSKVECQDFPTPCDVPPGWEIENSGREKRIKIPDYFITEWLDNSFDNNQGHVWLHGNTKKPGIQTGSFGNRPKMATITFKLKKAGKVNVKVSEGSMSAQDNVTADIDKGDLPFTIIEPGQSFNEVISETPTYSEQPNIIQRLTGIIRKLLKGNN
jgi:uncharacterized protein YbdZ (MbtH family)